MKQMLLELVRKNGIVGAKRILLKDEKEESEVQTQSRENELYKTLLSTPEMINLKMMGKKLGMIQELYQTRPMTARQAEHKAFELEHLKIEVNNLRNLLSKETKEMIKNEMWRRQKNLSEEIIKQVRKKKAEENNFMLKSK